MKHKSLTTNQKVTISNLPTTTTTLTASSITATQAGDYISIIDLDNNNKKQYNIKKVHIARRRAAKKKNKDNLPSVWVINDTSSTTFSI